MSANTFLFALKLWNSIIVQSGNNHTAVFWIRRGSKSVTTKRWKAPQHITWAKGNVVVHTRSTCLKAMKWVQEQQYKKSEKGISGNTWMMHHWPYVEQCYSALHMVQREQEESTPAHTLTSFTESDSLICNWCMSKPQVLWKITYAACIFLPVTLLSAGIISFLFLQGFKGHTGDAGAPGPRVSSFTSKDLFQVEQHRHL